MIVLYCCTVGYLTPLETQSRFGDKLLEIRLVCPQNGTAVLKGLSATSTWYVTCRSEMLRMSGTTTNCLLCRSNLPWETYPAVDRAGCTAPTRHRECFLSFLVPDTDQESTAVPVLKHLSRGAIVKRTHVTHKNLYISPFY